MTIRVQTRRQPAGAPPAPSFAPAVTAGCRLDPVAAPGQGRRGPDEPAGRARFSTRTVTTGPDSPRLVKDAIVGIGPFNPLAVAPRIEELAPHGFAPVERELARAFAGGLGG